MKIEFSLPSHLQSFLREQLAAGRYQSESEVIQAALALLEANSHAPEDVCTWLKQEIDRGLESRPAEPLTAHFWEQLRGRLCAGSASGYDD